MPNLRLLSILVLALFVAACGSTGTTINPLGQGVTIHADPSGDAGAAPTFDVIEFRSERTATDLLIRIWTSPAMVLPAAGTLSVAGQTMFIVGFNTDNNRATGASMGSNCGGGQGLDHAVFGGFTLARNPDGTFPVAVTGALPGGGSATASVDGPRLTLTVPLAALGGDDGRTEAHVLVGNGPPAGLDWRDCAPDAGQMVPTRTGEKVLSR